jgi:hypothetical protein
MSSVCILIYNQDACATILIFLAVKYFVDALGRIDDINAKKVQKLQDSYQFPGPILVCFPTRIFCSVIELIHLQKMLHRWPKFKAHPLNVTKKCDCCKIRNAVFLLDAVGNPYCKRTLCPLNSKPFADLAKVGSHLEIKSQANLFFKFRNSLPARCARKTWCSFAIPLTSR